MFPYHKPFMLWTRDIVVKRLKTFQSYYIKLALNFVVRLYYQCISYSITVNQLKQPNTWNYPIHTSIFFFNYIYHVFILYELNEAGWRIYASLNWVIIGSCNCLLPFWHQVITWTSDEFLSNGPLGQSSARFFIEIKTFALTKLHLKMSFVQVAVIVSRLHCVI